MYYVCHPEHAEGSHAYPRMQYQLANRLQANTLPLRGLSTLSGAGFESHFRIHQYLCLLAEANECDPMVRELDGKDSVSPNS